MTGLLSIFGKKLGLVEPEARRLPVPLRETPSLPPELSALTAYSMSGSLVLQKLYRLAQDVVQRQIPGDMVECGVCNGGSAGAIASAMRDTGRTLWLYDSFLGMPVTTPIDGSFAPRYVGECVGAVENVRAAMAIAQLPEERYIIREGWFYETFHPPLPQPISLLHIDADWYDSVMLCLTTFYDRVAEGGIIILDDFGHWEGCREAFYDFVQQRQIKPLLERFGHSQVFWVKERSHNRAFSGQWTIP